MAAPQVEQVRVGCHASDVLADIACKKETGLLQSWVAAEFAYQEILVEENAEALAELSDWRDDLRRTANEVVAGS